MGVRFVVRSAAEPASEYEYQFDQERVVIGRNPGADVCLPDPSVSGKHATVHAKGSGYVLVDEGSTNGTSVGGVRLVPGRPKPLQREDRFEICGFEISLRASVPVADVTSADRTAALARRMVREVLDPLGERSGPPRLLVLNGPDEGKSLRVPPPPVRLLVGRGEACALVLTDADTSREHLEVTRDLDGLEVADLGSKNGLAVNGRVVPRARLKDRDEVAIGATVLVFEDPAQAAVNDRAAGPDVILESAPKADPAAPPSATPPRAATAAQEVPQDGAEPTEETRRRAGPGADLVIYLLAAVVLAMSIAGLLALLQAE